MEDERDHELVNDPGVVRDGDLPAVHVESKRGHRQNPDTSRADDLQPTAVLSFADLLSVFQLGSLINSRALFWIAVAGSSLAGVKSLPRLPRHGLHLDRHSA
jgi:hypothetical protein